jgi:hypothetical protein
MKSLAVVPAPGALTAGAAGAADAKGCIKGAVVGGVAGHFAHHHALLGAAAGCAIGHHLAHKHALEQKRAAPLAAAHHN